MCICISDRYYTDKHEWISVEGSTGRIGITDYAQVSSSQTRLTVIVRVLKVHIQSKLLYRTPVMGMQRYQPSQVPLSATGNTRTHTQ